jgi:hypothetical protein
MTPLEQSRGVRAFAVLALPVWQLDGRLHPNAVAGTIGALSDHAPVVAASVMHPFADLLFADIQRSSAVWACDDHPLLRFQPRHDRRKYTALVALGLCGVRQLARLRQRPLCSACYTQHN